MKLLACKSCHDVVALLRDSETWRRCCCGLSIGRYEGGGDVAQVCGNGVILAVDTGSLRDVVLAVPSSFDATQIWAVPQAHYRRVDWPA